MNVTLPWPPAILNPNRRAHWAVKAKAAAKYKRDCLVLAQGAGLRALRWDGMRVTLTFHPPSARRADLDNMLAAAKSGLDGLAIATGVDDSLWEIDPRKGDPVKGGEVLVQVEPLAPPDGWQSIGQIAQQMIKGQVR